MQPKATIHYAALNREEAAMDLRDCLRQVGFQAEATYRRESADHLREIVLMEQPPFRAMQIKTWAEAREIAHQRRTEGAKVVLLRPEAQMPTRGSEQAAGLDLYYDGHECRIISDSVGGPRHGIIRFAYGDRYVLSTGIAIRPPAGHYCRVAPRSGMAIRGFDVSAGVIDADYTGEIKVILTNQAKKINIIEPGERIAQLIFEKCSLAELIQVNALDQTVRQDGGFGSTGA